MTLITDIHAIPRLDKPSGLTIGSFDGVHLGHQILLNCLRAKLPSGSPLVVFSFSNHPSHYFSSVLQVPLICPPLQKAKLLMHYGVDLVLLIPFTSELSKQSFDQFLSFLKSQLSFTHLVLGEGASFGKNREGNEANVKQIAKSLDFEVEYLPKYTLNGTPVSSGYVRRELANGRLEEVKALLGRPYSLLLEIDPASQSQSRKIQEKTAPEPIYALNIKGLCLPPDGTYPVLVKTSTDQGPAVAEILAKEHTLFLKFSYHSPFTDKKEIEIIF